MWSKVGDFVVIPNAKSILEHLCAKDFVQVILKKLSNTYFYKIKIKSRGSKTYIVETLYIKRALTMQVFFFFFFSFLLI